MTAPVLILEENHDLPLCRIQWTTRMGAAADQQLFGVNGLANFAAELMRRGAAGKTRAYLDEALDRMGAGLTVHCGHDSVTFDLLVLKEHLAPACQLFAEMMLQPDFSEAEAEQLREEIAADWDELREDDSRLANHFFPKVLYGAHPYGSSLEGTSKDLLTLTTTLAKQWHQRCVLSQTLIMGVAGNLSLEEWQRVSERWFGPLLQPQATSAFSLPMPQPPRARMWLVDKPERTQSQILLGQLAPAWQDDAFLPLQVGTAAFGGTFTARLMQEVRAKRGLSYGASASLSTARYGCSLVAHVFPSAEQTAETLELVLRLYAEWAQQGLSQEEVEFTKGYLARSHAFSIQTPDARLRRRTHLEICGMPQERLLTFPARVQAVTPSQVNDALRQCITPDQLAMAIVCTAAFQESRLTALSALQNVPTHVIAYDQDDV